jgi:hypothetical protein
MFFNVSYLKTYARFVTELKDDFAWENDKIAFSTFGKALEKKQKEMLMVLMFG